MYYKRNPVPQMPVEGWYKATISEVAKGKLATTQYGPSETVLLTFITHQASVVTQQYLLAPGVSFAIEKLLNCILDTDEEEINLEELKGKACGIEVKHRQTNNRLFANVVDVCPVDELIDDESE